MRYFILAAICLGLLLTYSLPSPALAMSCPGQVRCPYDNQAFFGYARPNREGGECTCKYTHMYGHTFYTYCEGY